MEERAEFRTRNCFLFLLTFYIGLFASSAITVILKILLGGFPFMQELLSVLSPLGGLCLFALLTYTGFRASARSQLSKYMYLDVDLAFLLPKKSLFTQLSVTVGLWLLLYFAATQIAPEDGKQAVTYLFYLLPLTLPQIVMTNALTVIFGSFLPSYVISVLSLVFLLFFWLVGLFCAYFGHKHTAEEIIGLKRGRVVKRKKGKKRKKEPYEDFKKLPHKNYLDD